MAGTPVADGNVTFLGGQDDGLQPSQIGEDRYRRGINLTTKDGKLGPRAGFVYKKIEVITPGGVDALSYQQIYDDGKYQGDVRYNTRDGDFILAVFSGVIFYIDPRNFKAEVLKFEKEGDRMNQYRRRIPGENAGRFVVFHDYPNLPVIVDGKTVRRANRDRESSPGVPLPEIPTSVLGIYVNNHLWVANDGHEFIASDATGGANLDAPITFETTMAPAAQYLGQSFSLGSQSRNQPITAMGFLQVADSSTGIGPLIVGTRDSLYAYRADIERASWEQTSFGRILLYKAGPRGYRSLCNLNSDLIIDCGDNQIRTLALSVGEQQRWTNLPISNEVKPFLDEFAQIEWPEISFVDAWRNHVFVAVAPYSTEAKNTNGATVFDYAHGGFIVLELANIAGLGASVQPAWAGLWTGISPMGMVVLDEGPYVFSKDDDGKNRLYFVDFEKTYDEFQGKEKNIICRLYTREYDFQNKFADKEVGSVDYDFTNIEGLFHMRAEYRGSHLSRWALWRDFEHAAKTQVEEIPEGENPKNWEPHSLRELNFGDPDEKECDELTEDLGTVLKKVALRLTISARNWNLEAIRLRFSMLQELDRPSVNTCDNLGEREVIGNDEPLDWELYRTTGL